MSASQTLDEPARRIPVAAEYDVLVVGGGIAGVAAAIAAARQSASVCLIERYCALGGLATMGNVTIWLPLCDGMGTQVVGGLGEELLELSVADLGQDRPAARFRGVPDCWRAGGDPADRAERRFRAEFNPSSYVLALEELVLNAGVDVAYDTRFCGAVRDGDRITHVIVENKDGRSALAGRAVIDATGDADVCHAAGEKTVSLDSNVVSGWFYTLSGGRLTLHQFSSPYCPHAGRENARGPFFRGDCARDVTEQIIRTRSGIRERLAAIRAEHPDEDVQPIMPPMTACFRMTRRLVGRATLEGSHVHRWFDDVVGLTGDWRTAGPVFAIPFASLCAVATSNLLVAGRCMSVDCSAWDVLRAIPACVVTGQAAGTAAALACDHRRSGVDAVPCSELRSRLEEQGALLDRALVAEERAGVG